MKHPGKGVKVVGLLLFLAETDVLSEGKGSILRLDNILILFSFSYQLLSLRNSNFLVACHIIVHVLSKLK